MRHVTRDEILNDLEQLKHQIITPISANRISQYFHFDEFFKHQMNAWKQMSTDEQSRILKDARIKEILADGTYDEFYTTVANLGRTPKFTTFNVEMMNLLLKTYQPETIIDPCMGWGHRLLMCATRNINYFGYDINPITVKHNNGLHRFIEHNSSMKTLPTSITLSCEDGVDGISHLPSMKSNTMLFTCPPYFDSEIYGENGIENTSYDEFVQWWGQVAQQAISKKIDLFAFQITPKYGEDLRKITESNGYQFIEIIENTRKPDQPDVHVNTKGEVAYRQYGQIYVFKHPNKGEL